LLPENKRNKIYKMVILPVVLYGHKIWFLTLKKKLTVMAFENRKRRIFEPEKSEVTGGWRRFHNEELHNLYSSSDITRMIKLRIMRWQGILHAWES
jgi:hypothetical protein